MQIPHVPVRPGLGAQVLADLGADTLVLCGGATGMAVMTAVIQCADMFYKVIVPSDAAPYR